MPASLLASIATPRFTLVSLRAHHAEPMYAGLSDPDGYAFIPQVPPDSVAALAARYAMLERGSSPDGSESWLNWVIERLSDGMLLGYLQATVAHTDRLIYIAYFVFAAHRRQGIAGETLRALLPALTAAYAGYRIEAQIDTRNAASLALVESLGFVRVRTVREADVFKGSVSDEHHYAYPHAAAGA